MRRVCFLALLCAFVFVSVKAHAVEIERVRTPGGIEAWLIEDRTVPVVSLHLAFRGGSALDPDGQEGRAAMATALLTEGAGELDSQAFQGRIEDLALSLGFEAGQDAVFGTLRTLSRNRDEAFGLLRLALTAPRFDDEPLARVKSQMLTAISRRDERPERAASQALMAALFGNHPYGRPDGGEAASVEAMTADDLRAFVAERFAHDNLVIGVVGDIDAGQLASLLDATFAPLPDRAAPWDLPKAEVAFAPAPVVIERAVPQSAVRFAGPGLRRDDPDFYAATVLNYILGGGSFASRLFKEVREKRGLVYSVHTQLVPFDRAGLIVGGAGTANERVAETIAVIRDQWRLMAEQGATEAEVADAKTFLTGSFPLRFESSGALASILVAIQMDDLGIDYLERRNALVEAVTPDDVNRLARRLLDPDRLPMVVVGRPEGVE